LDDPNLSNYVGKRLGRVDGWEKVTGKARYAGDYSMPGMLELAVIRSSEPHAMITSLDTSSVSDDVYVFTAADLSENIIEDIINDQPVLASDRVRFFGEPIAIVAADSREAAQQAARSVVISYQKLPVVDNPREAILPNSEKLFDQGNLLSEFHHTKGDPDNSFADCDLILEDDFFLPVQDHGYLEPDAAFAYMDGDILRMLTSSQNVFHDRRIIARALGLPLDKIQVQAATVGGGFGGKDGHINQVFAALVTLKTGKPAKIVFDRTEVIIGTYKRHAADIHIKFGFTQDGFFKAFEGKAWLDTGAYAGLGPAVMGLFSEHFGGPYQIPNVKLDVYLAYTNKPPAHAMRGFGAPQGAFATETLISRAARQLGIDPLEIRRKNALTEGSIGTLGQKMEHVVGLREALTAVENSQLWQEHKQNQDPAIGYGVAAGYLSCGLGKGIPDSAKVEISENEKGHYVIRIGLVDIGQGSKTALTAIAADVLDCRMENVTIIMADTNTTYDCGSTAGSRSVFIAGNAIIAAAKEFRRKKEEKADNPKAIGSATFPESSFSFPNPGFPHAMYTFIAQAVKLQINPVSGQIRLLDIFAATEAGHIINPLSMDGQIQGGIVMSLGYTFGEGMQYQAGIPQHQSFTNYIMPTAMDVPSIRNISVDSYEKSGPMGAKGAAEVATVVIAPAINAAVESISGAKLNALPLDNESVLAALKNK
jgi:CO/xanthine dehydrogenase Mo-binding subunit